MGLSSEAGWVEPGSLIFQECTQSDASLLRQTCEGGKILVWDNDAHEALPGAENSVSTATMRQQLRTTSVHLKSCTAFPETSA